MPAPAQEAARGKCVISKRPTRPGPPATANDSTGTVPDSPARARIHRAHRRPPLMSSDEDAVPVRSGRDTRVSSDGWKSKGFPPEAHHSLDIEMRLLLLLSFFIGALDGFHWHGPVPVQSPLVGRMGLRKGVQEASVGQALSGSAGILSEGRCSPTPLHPLRMQVGAASEEGKWEGYLWEGLSRKSIHSATVDWVKTMVIGLNLCPFALASMPGLKVVVGDVRDRDDALEIINDELIMLAEKPKDKPATTLIVFPPKLFEQLRAADGMVDIATDVLGNFEEFLELAEEANNLCSELGDEVPGADDALLLTFHPDSTYSDAPNDPSEYSLRSPYPVVHLLRGSDVGLAEEDCEAQGKTTEDIALENEARLRGEGWKELGKMMKAIIDKHTGQ